MGDDSPEAVERRSEFAQLLRDLAPDLRDAVCQFLREYEQLADEQALLMQFLAEVRSLSRTQQIDLCARIEQAVKPENEQEKSFFRALVRCLLDIAEGPGSTGPRALKARACV